MNFGGAAHNEKPQTDAAASAVRALRQRVEDGGHHKHFTDDWADFRYIEISAANEDQARARLEDRYPAKQGFVIDSIAEQQSSKFE